MVFQLLDENGLCQYYDLTNMPGVSAKGNFLSSKYDYLDNQAIQDQLIQFKSEAETYISEKTETGITVLANSLETPELISVL